MLARLTTVVMTLAAATGCQPSLRSADLQPHDQSGRRVLPPMLARMQRKYADLHTGRFVCLADFNTRPQAALFRILGPDGTQARSQPTISVRRSIDETGAGGLQARLNGPQDQLLFDGARSEKLALVRDWREYHLLLLSMYGPPDGLMLEFSVQSGSDAPIRWTRNLFARPGWHLYRLDLAQIGEDIDLAEVRALRWRAPRITAPVDLYLDDLILTDNTRYLLGENAADGEFYALTRGRRIHVGARGRFELAFCDGVIVEWHADQQRNLTVRSGLGPWPVPLPEDWNLRRADPVVYDDPALFADWGERVTATQRLVEKSGFRVVIEGVWRFLPGWRAAGADLRPPAAPAHSWRYVIYPSGQVCVRTTSRVRDAFWSDERVGYTVALDGRSGFTRVICESTSDEEPGPNFVLMTQPGRQRPDLLWCLHSPAAATRQLELVSADERRLAITVGDVEPTDTVDAAHLLRFWPRDIDAAPEAESFAADYQRPAALVASRGRVVTDAAGDLDRDGFNESEGCYELMLEAGLLRFRLRPGSSLRHHPIFRVHGTAGQDCWVYVDGRIIHRQGRDIQGNLLFTLSRAVGVPLTIEVNTRSRSTPSSVLQEPIRSPGHGVATGPVQTVGSGLRGGEPHAASLDADWQAS